MRRQRGPQNGHWGQSAGPSPSITRSQTGQRTLIIGSLRLRLGRFFPRLALAPRSRPVRRAGRGGLVTRSGLVGRLGRFLVGLGRRLVRLAPVVGLVEARALEEDRRAD